MAISFAFAASISQGGAEIAGLVEDAERNRYVDLRAGIGAGDVGRQDYIFVARKLQVEAVVVGAGAGIGDDYVGCRQIEVGAAAGGSWLAVEHGVGDGSGIGRIVDGAQPDGVTRALDQRLVDE